MTPYSAAAEGSFSSPGKFTVGSLAHVLRKVLRLDLLAQLGQLGLLLVALQPSSSWIAFSCWRRKYSRWPLSNSDWDLRLDLGAELDDLQLAVEDAQDVAEPARDVDTATSSPASPRP
jgi:hypothetical protein